MRLQEKSRAELEAFQAECQQAYKQFQEENLKLDMSRGKPAPAQLELSMDMMDCLKKGDYRAENGLDCRNYGVLDGLPETKAKMPVQLIRPHRHFSRWGRPQSP